MNYLLTVSKEFSVEQTIANMKLKRTRAIKKANKVFERLSFSLLLRRNTFIVPKIIK